MTRVPLIAGNWKMNKTNSDARVLADELKKLLSDAKFDFSKREVLVCPPFTALSDVSNVLQGSGINVGAQDLFYKDSGAFTSKVSAPMLLDIGCTHVIIGHSETRQFFHESHRSVNLKVKKALEAGLTPIMCVGELLEEREAGNTLDVIRLQLEEGLEDVDLSSEEVLSSLVIAYEPVWAIGTGKVATPTEAQEVHKFIRSIVGEKIRILYGGSVKPGNVSSLMAMDDIDGALVGGASLSAEDFSQIARYDL